MDQKKFEETCKMGRPFVEENERRVIFMKHMYKCSGREDPNHAMHSLYTGLWHDFCLNEAGPAQRDLWFQRMQFVQDVNDGKINPDGTPRIIDDPVDEYFDCVVACEDDDPNCHKDCVAELKDPPVTSFDSPHQQAMSN